jgi:bifunctional non-homologous end joining protein LigD
VAIARAADHPLHHADLDFPGHHHQVVIAARPAGLGVLIGGASEVKGHCPSLASSLAGGPPGRHIRPVLHKSPFIQPSTPTLRARPPTGDRWLHEVKFDGFRVQLHRHGSDVTIYSKNGRDFTHRYTAIEQSLEHLPVKDAIIDGELVVCDTGGLPDFRALHAHSFQQDMLCVWAFDLLALNGKDLRELPLTARKAKLEVLLSRHDDPFLRFSHSFGDAEQLLAECSQRGLEGIVSKRGDAPYRSGKADWIKVKTAKWREANKDRGDLFDKRKR